MVEKDSKCSQKKKNIFFADKLSLYNMAASSGLGENNYPSKFFSKFIFIILLIMINE